MAALYSGDLKQPLNILPHLTQNCCSMEQMIALDSKAQSNEPMAALYSGDLQQLLNILSYLKQN